MHDSVGVEIMQGSDELLGDFPYFDFLKVLVVFDDVEELALAKLGDDNELGIGLEGIQQQNDIFVFEFFQYLYFFSHRLDVFFLLALLLDGLDGHELPCQLFAGFVHFSVGTLADQREDVVVLSPALCHIFEIQL